MKSLLVEDEFTSRVILQKILLEHGQCDIAVNGKEAVSAFKMALNEEAKYDVVCMDIMMPEMDGREAVKLIRETEKESGINPVREVKIIMTTADKSIHSVTGSLKEGATSYISKPIEKKRITEELKEFGLV